MNRIAVFGGLKRAIWRGIVLPGIHALRREPVVRELAYLERTQWIEPNQLKALQRDKLYKLLKHCRKNIPGILFGNFSLFIAGLSTSAKSARIFSLSSASR